MAKIYYNKNKLRQHKKTKQQTDVVSYVIYGRHASIAAIKNENRIIEEIYVNKNTVHSFPELKGYNNIKIIDNKGFNSILPKDAVHQGIAVKVKYLLQPDIEDVIENKLVIVLDQVTDPHNIGSILRSSLGFGAGAVITTKNNFPGETGALAKSASGALEKVPLITVTNLVAAIDYLKTQGFWIFGFDANATHHLSKLNAAEKTALVFGAEGKGLRRLTSEKCDSLIKIPLSNGLESLNVSVAVAVALYECSK